MRKTFLLFKKMLVLLLFLLIGNVAAGRTETSVRAEIDKDRIRIGEVVTLTIEVEAPEDAQIVFGEEPEILGQFSVLERRLRSERSNGLLVQKAEFELDVYKTGELSIPPVRVLVKADGEDQIFDSPEVPVTVVSLLGSDDADIKPVKGLLHTRGPWTLIIICMILLAVIAALAAFFLWYKRRKAIAEQIETQLSPEEIAYRDLRKLKDENLPEKGFAREYYFRLSDVVRLYLEGRFSLRAPEMTTEEFLNELKHSECLNSRHKDLLRDFLNKCDMVKFARYGPKPIEVLDSYNAAVRLVEETSFKEEKA